jgi:hypothetical protein
VADQKPDWEPRFRRRVPLVIRIQGDAAVKAWLELQKEKRR